jgi:hypothetical protein
MNVGKILGLGPRNEQDGVPKNQKQKDWKQFMISRIIIDVREVRSLKIVLSDAEVWIQSFLL